MPVMDSKGSYDILLGRDWLHAVNAVGDYEKNQYTITNKGKQAILAGKVYTTREVELSSADEGSDDSEEELSEEEEEGEEEEEDEEEEEKTKNDAENEEPVLAQSFRACVVSLDELDLKVAGSRPSPPSPPQALQLRIEQMEEIDLSPDLTTTQQEQAKALLWEYRDCFANNLEELGNTDIVEHEINLKPEARPFYCTGIKHFASKVLVFIRSGVE